MIDKNWEELFGVETLKDNDIISLEEYYDWESVLNGVLEIVMQDDLTEIDTIKVVKIFRNTREIVDDEYEDIREIKLRKGELNYGR